MKFNTISPLYSSDTSISKKNGRVEKDQTRGNNGFVTCYYHVTGFSDLADLWVINKSLRSFVHVVHPDHVNRTRNADHAARARFVHFIEIHEVRKGLWAFFS